MDNPLAWTSGYTEARVERETDRARIETKRQASYLAIVAQACVVAALMSWDATDYRFFGEVAIWFVKPFHRPGTGRFNNFSKLILRSQQACAYFWWSRKGEIVM